ncbi:unnamed protein product [Polarella glacialis]|uniref:Cyclin N-terminal domain-containing protein n=1 Tax=Polarella glacialis TaxID=89957 RepID=A0A813K0F4_POLGL|nr:unnamed protein product [Polarella glacialis]
MSTVPILVSKLSTVAATAGPRSGREQRLGFSGNGSFVAPALGAFSGGAASARSFTRAPAENVRREAQQQEEEAGGDPQSVAEYMPQIVATLFAEEAIHMPAANYMELQTDINGKMRAILIDWLCEVHMKYRQGCRKVYITDNTYTKEDILNTECAMLAALAFNAVVPHFFQLNRCDGAQPSERPHGELARYMIELALVITFFNTCLFANHLNAALGNSGVTSPHALGDVTTCKVVSHSSHKKLVLIFRNRCTDLQEIMSKFKCVESKSTAIQVQERRSLATNSLALSPRQYQDSPQFCKVPDMPVLLGSPRERPLTMCSVQEIKKVPEVYSVPAIDMLPSIPKYPQQFQRSKSEGQDKLKDFCWSSMSIPVVRTFIHFGTPQHLKRTRSNSV